MSGSGGARVQTIRDEGTALTQRSDLDFQGAGVSGADVGGRTVITIPGSSASLPSNVLTKTANYTALVGDLIQADATSAGFTITLPAAPATGALVTIIKTDASVNSVAVLASGGGTVNGDAGGTSIDAQHYGAIFEHLGSNAWRWVAVTNTGGGSWLAATAVKTANYTAASSDLVPVDASGGSVTVTLPTAPPDKTQVAVKVIALSGTNTVTISRGGSTDVFNKAGGSTSLTLSTLNQGVILQYATTGGIWYVLADDLSFGQLDARFLPTGVSGVANLGANQTVDFKSLPLLLIVSGTFSANLAVTANNPVFGSRLMVLGPQDATGSRTLTVNGTSIQVPGTPTTGIVFVEIVWADTTNFRVLSGGSSPITTQDDLIVGGVGGALARLAKGSNGQVLTVNPATGNLAWITPSGGGGGGGTVPFVATFGYTLGIVVGGSNITNSNGIPKAVRFTSERTITLDTCKIIVNTAASAGGVYRVAIYTDNAGIPGTLIDESSGTDVTTSPGVVPITGLSAAVVAGSRYWAVGVPQGAPTTAATFKGEQSGGSGRPDLPSDPTNFSNQSQLQWGLSVTGAFPGSGGIVADWAPGGNRPAIWLGAST